MRAIVQPKQCLKIAIVIRTYFRLNKIIQIHFRFSIIKILSIVIVIASMIFLYCCWFQTADSNNNNNNKKTKKKKKKKKKKIIKKFQ